MPKLRPLFYRGLTFVSFDCGTLRYRGLTSAFDGTTPSLDGVLAPNLVDDTKTSFNFGTSR